MDRSKPLVLGGSILLATAAIAVGSAIGLSHLTPPPSRIGRLQPVHTSVHAKVLHDHDDEAHEVDTRPDFDDD